MMKLKLSLFLISVLTISACSEVKDTRYRDTTVLEIPPTIEIVDKAPETVFATEEDILDQGLGDRVQLAGSENLPIIKIKKLFYRSWNLVEQALKLNDIQVKDKNRDLGVFYVLYSSEEASAETASLGNITSFFFNDTVSKSGYKLTVVWKESDTEIAAELVVQDDENLLDDDEDKEDFDVSIDNSAALINTLYKTLKHDLKIN